MEGGTATVGGTEGAVNRKERRRRRRMLFPRSFVRFVPALSLKLDERAININAFSSSPDSRDRVELSLSPPGGLSVLRVECFFDIKEGYATAGFVLFVVSPSLPLCRRPRSTSVV